MRLALVAIVLALAAVTCAREDGQPDPPTQVLVPCHRDAGADDPLACPPGPDAGTDAAP